MFAIGLSGVFSLGGWCRLLQTGFLRSRPTQDASACRLLAGTGLSPSADGLPRPFPFTNFHGVEVLQPRSCRNITGLGSSAFARHYLRNHCYFLFLRVLRCFSSPRLPPLLWVTTSLWPGCPIRKSPDQWLFAPPRSLSQLITSFLASESQGIPHALLVTFSNFHSFFSFFAAPRTFARRCACQACFCQYVNELSSPFGDRGYRENQFSTTYIRTRMNQQIPKRLRIAVCDETSPERRYSSHTFRYGYLVTT